MAGQTGIEHFFNFRVRVQMAGNGLAVGVVLKHANGKSLDAARSEEAIHGREAGSGGSLDEINSFGVVGAAEDDGAAGGIAMAIEIFGHGVNDDVGAEFQGALKIGTEEGVVNNESGSALVREAGHGGDVGETHGGIGRRFDVKHFSVGTERAHYQSRL